MKKFLKSLGKTFAIIGFGAALGLTPVILTSLFGPTPALIITIGLLTSVLFYVIYSNEK